MHLLIPLVSLMGPVYFAVRGWPIVFVLVWAAIWTALRLLVTWKSVYATLQEHDKDKPPGWFARHPYVLMPGVVLVTLVTFEAVHITVYWLVARLIETAG